MSNSPCAAGESDLGSLNLEFLSRDVPAARLYRTDKGQLRLWLMLILSINLNRLNKPSMS